MKAAKTWCLAGLILVAGLSSASCGKDEGTDGGGGKGSLLGGSGGSGGQVGRSGSTSSDGGDGPSAATKLGRACVSDNDCKDTAAPGLTCVTANDTVFDNGAPPKGLCTTTCTMPDANEDDPCAALGPDGMCFPFTSGSNEGYCIEGCNFGTPDIGAGKCHNRQEFACNPALLGATSNTCTTTDDCPAGDLCIDGQCDVVFAGCLPACRGDLDCEADMFCDQSFLNGTCVEKKPTGKGLGEPCTLKPDGEDAEPDECLGFCQADSDTGEQGHCAATCGLFRPCSFNSETSKFDGVCLYASILTSQTGDEGDFGFCTPSCNCTDDCKDSTLSCSLLDQGALNADFRGAGLCFSPAADTKEYNQCGAGGAGNGGAGGVDSSGGGAAGAGAAGESSGGTGTGGVAN